ncbi:MAG: hypothetical protein GFH27_549313n133 [Chloroflexi bacterium AL-W]|nr:hypothetical protein [Chloroflexi bacterium AL-N1]NOK69556.1 hypothetical protein [Chloroflexi bacterium AL-N10]NOK77521.1 hypothetical protein [Chloroflexi bacterium AL-N5]NOK84372.1 hypothetical protein [Chloroflexi bacterium AL-W]NOK91462.1 hypothetical protein [Chloroflexi bacterium AL-N15]
MHDFLSLGTFCTSRRIYGRLGIALLILMAVTLLYVPAMAVQQEQAEFAVMLPLIMTGSDDNPQLPTPTPTPLPPNPIPTPPGDITPEPTFEGPFCTDEGTPKIIGFDDSPGVGTPTTEDFINYSLEAVNFLRWRTTLPPLQPDPALNDIAERALAYDQGHGYFIENCMSTQYDYGRNCEAGWAQENIGGAWGSSRTWKDGVRVPLCRMMEEPKGGGHRANIESEEWTRLGVAGDVEGTGAYWFHEFGR